jgi:hypothetical protein
VRREVAVVSHWDGDRYQPMTEERTRAIALVREARSEALEELGRIVRHELATVVHVGSHALESCEEADFAATARWLRAAVERSQRLLRVVEGYAEDDQGLHARASVASVRDGVLSALGRRFDAPTVADIVFRVENVHQLELAVAPATLTQALVEALSALLSWRMGISQLVVTGRTVGADRIVISALCEETGERTRSWRLDAAADALGRCGGTLSGPVRIDRAPGHPGAELLVELLLAKAGEP